MTMEFGRRGEILCLVLLLTVQLQFPRDCRAEYHCLRLSLCPELPESYDDTCSCDDQCVMYDDCCINAHVHDGVIAGYHTENIRQTIECTDPQNIVYELNYVVSRCPDTFSDVITRQRCENETDVSQDPVATTPVSGVISGLVFKNIFCASCHGSLEVEELLYWQLKVDCGRWDLYEYRDNYYDSSDDHYVYPRPPLPFPTSTESAQKEQENVTLHSIDWTECSATYEPPEGIKHPRGCQLAISECHPDWTDDGVAALCSSHTSYSYLSGEVAYKNIFCGVCNFEFPEFLSCEKSPGVRPPPPPVPSMRYLLDLNQGTLTQTSAEGDRKTSFTQCPNNTTLDYYYQTCRPLFCMTGSVMNNDGECEPADGDPALWNQTSCALVSLNSSEYVMYENETVYVESLGLELEPGEYVDIYNESVIGVCASYFEALNFTNVDSADTEMYLVEAYLTLVGYVLSMIGMLIVFVVYMLLPELRNVPGKCMLNLVTSLFFTQLLFLTMNVASSGSTFCLVQSITLHFLYLVAFFWMNVLGFDIWHTFRFQFSSHDSHHQYKRLVAYHMYAWGMPLLIILFSLSVDFEVIPAAEDIRPCYGEALCWINTKWGHLCFFVGPAALLLIANIVFFSLTIYNICHTAATAASDMASTGQTLSKKWYLLLNIKLSAIMGLTWTFGFIANLTPDSPVLWYLFVVCGSLQGVFICLGFVCRKKVYQLLKARLSIQKADVFNTASTKISNRVRGLREYKAEQHQDSCRISQ